MKISIPILVLFLTSSICVTNSQNKFDTDYGNNNAVGKYVDLNGAKIYYEEYGKGEPLLLIHGCGGDIKSMENQIDFFKNKYRVIVADNRGQGKSELKTDSLTYTQITKDWEGLVNHLKLDSISILGWSDGGIIGLEMGISNKTKIKKIIAMGANLRPDTTAVNSWAPAEVRKYQTEAKEMKAKGDTSRNWNLELQLFGLLLDQPNINPLDLKKITTSVLIMVGDRDIIKNEHAVEIYNNLPKGQLCIMPGMGHNAPQNNPILFNEIANRFLTEPFDYGK
ncbi:alpha/beta hydrolase [Flavobacterium sp. WC2421]|uniref:alpha/beta fold hydrolase n=1 Tax=Flavobacterium sp. WC2421 TaxID=3234138 RepID=UPI0034668DCB